MNLLNIFGGGGRGGGAAVSDKSLFDFTVKEAKGGSKKLSDYKGKAKAFVLVNVASKWGLTAQNYEELAVLYKKYSPAGLEILGFPCNQFGSQEPGTDDEIQNFAKARGATYPIFAKIEVNGDGADPLYKFLKACKGGFLGDDIKWNFTKFLVNSEGAVVKRYGPPESPLSLVKDIEELLA